MNRHILFTTCWLALFSVLLFSTGQSSSAQIPQISQGSQTFQSAVPEGQPLAVGIPLQRNLKGGEQHVYRLHIEKGQFVHLIVEQKEIVVGVTIFDPEGTPVYDIPRQLYGTEPILFLAEREGQYRVEIRSGEATVPAGSYEVTVKALRAQTPQDRSLVQAHGAYKAGLQLSQMNTREALLKALEKYQAASQYYKEAGDRDGEALAQNNLGQIQFAFGNLKPSLDAFHQADLLIDPTDTRAKAGVLLNLGVVQEALHETQTARATYLRALEVLNGSTMPDIEGIVLNNLGMLYCHLSEYQEALNCFQQALKLLQAEVGRRMQRQQPGQDVVYSVATTLNNLGLVFAELGNLEKATDYYQQALSLYSFSTNPNAKAYPLINLGNLLVTTQTNKSENLKKALKYYDEALPLIHLMGERLKEASLLNNQGTAYLRLGDWLKAEEQSVKSLTLATQLGDRKLQGHALINLGGIAFEQGDFPKALDFLTRAQELNRSVKDRGGLAVTLYYLARLETQRKNLSAAKSFIQEAIELSEFTRTHAGSQEQRISYLATVDQYYRFNIDLLMRMHRENPTAGHDAEALKVSEQLRARSLLDLLTEGQAEIKRGIAPDIAQTEQQVRQALSIALENQTRLLNGNQKDPDFPIRKAQAEKEVERRTLEYQDLQIQIRSKYKGYADLQYPQPLGLKEIQKNLLDPDTVLLEYSLGDQQSYLWVATQTSLVSYELPRKAEVGQVAQKVYECLIAQGLEAEFLQGATDPQAKARQKAMFNQYVAQKNAEFPQAAAALSDMIVQPAAALLSGRKRVFIVADGWLQYIPFAALPDPGVPLRKTQPLIVNHEILNLPSASTLSVLQNNLTGRQLAPKKMALLADPVFSPADSRVRPVTSQQVGQPVAEKRLACPWFSNPGFTPDRLPATRNLEHIVRSLVPPGQYTIALDFDANLKFATGNDLSHFQIVHFATHGMLNPENPDWSGLILSLVDVTGRPVPGFLTTLETFTLNLPAELVVLQGCQTGFGFDPFKTETGKLQSQNITNEGLTGLTRGLMYSGARRVLVTLWNVRDDSSSELMKRFYQKHLHSKNPMPPLAALRAAQLEMRHTSNWKSPYYWAGFLFYGEP